MVFKAEPVMLLETNMEKPESFENPFGETVIYSNARPIGAGENEDGVLFFPVNDRSAVMVVADGLGGHKGGIQAARIALEAFKKNISLYARTGKDSDRKLRDIIFDSFEQGNEEILKLGIGAGTTIVVAEIRDRTVRAYHAGDSKMLLIGQKGKRKWETMDHSPVGHGIEAGFLTEKESMDHKDRHIVNNMLGAENFKIEIGPEKQMADRDTLLLMSDGISDNMTMQEIIEVIRSGSISESAESLAKSVHLRMTEPVKGAPSKSDDASFVVFRPI